MKVEHEPCSDCNTSGYADKVMRGINGAPPNVKYCETCNGRGWKVIPKSFFQNLKEYVFNR